MRDEESGRLMPESPYSAFRTPHSAFPTLSVIAAASENNVIGRGGGLPWHLSADLARFKRLTMGHAIVMGRKTWDSIGRPLPGRLSIVLSRRGAGVEGATRPVDGAIWVADLDAALQAVSHNDVKQAEVFVIGGAAIYALALPRASRLYLTRVHARLAGDAFFPIVDWAEWELVEESYHAADEANEFAHTFQVYRRIRS
jgi:dihydrofolate reductase